MADEKKTEMVYDLGVIDTVLDDVPAGDPSMDEINELLDQLKGLKMTPPVQLTWERLEAKRAELKDFAAMDIQDKACVLALLAVRNARIRDNAKGLLEQAT